MYRLPNTFYTRNRFDKDYDNSIYMLTRGIHSHLFCTHKKVNDFSLNLSELLRLSNLVESI